MKICEIIGFTQTSLNTFHHIPLLNIRPIFCSLFLSLSFLLSVFHFLLSFCPIFNISFNPLILPVSLSLLFFPFHFFTCTFFVACKYYFFMMFSFLMLRICHKNPKPGLKCLCVRSHTVQTDEFQSNALEFRIVSVHSSIITSTSNSEQRGTSILYYFLLTATSRPEGSSHSSGFKGPFIS